MGWDERLFDLLDDLEGQAEALYAAERDAELADRSRAEYAGVTLAGRLMASVGRDVLLDLDGTGPVRGELRRVGTGWCLVSGDAATGWSLWARSWPRRGPRTGPCPRSPGRPSPGWAWSRRCAGSPARGRPAWWPPGAAPGFLVAVLAYVVLVVVSVLA